jgi:predicted transcriptional regulator
VTSEFSILSKRRFRTFKYRDRHSITVDILKAIAKSQKGSNKTQIMQRANINSTQINRYIDILLLNGFVLIDGHKYRLSEKGLMFLDNVEAEVLKVQWRR